MSARGLPRRVALCTLALSIALALGEVALRQLPEPGPARPGRPEPMLSRPVPPPSRRAYELVPGLIARQAFPGPAGDRTVTYTIDGRGLRTAARESSGEPAPARDGPRVAVVGDSFVFGQGVADRDTLPAQLERQLGARLDVEAEALNLGVPGYNVEQLAAVVDERALDLAPDLVLVVLYANDPMPIGAQAPQPEGEGLARWLQGSALARRLAQWSGWSRRQQSAAHLDWLRSLWDEQGEGWLRTQGSLQELAEAPVRERASIQVAFFPPLLELDRAPLAAEVTRLAGLCDQLGLPFHDLTPAFRGKRAADLWVHPADHHPTAEALGLAAHQLAQALEPSLR
jgi:hypothetical protein